MRNMKCTLLEQSINIQSEITNENSSKGEDGGGVVVFCGGGWRREVEESVVLVNV